MIKKQKTIKYPVSCTGIGLHTGVESTITFHPAKENFGVKFMRNDQKDQIVTPDIENVIDLTRGTTIEENGVRVHTTEHVMSACAGMGVTNLLIELNSKEPPVMDGSAKDFVAALNEGQIIEQDSKVDFLRITKPIFYADEEKDVEVFAVPYDGFKTTFTIQYDLDALDVQYSSVQNMYTNYEKQIAPARTFCLLSEVAQLEKQGLIKGGNLGNAVIIVDTDINDQQVKFFRKRFGIKFYEGTKGLYKSQILRFKNEPVRHKTLDLVGDLALLGKPILGHITAIRSGHKGNVEFAKLLRKEFKDQF
ncbi:MAG: UDP-3-O-acyl-N-acetylglucosamine deacetylase [Gammaproteobacteria bacterium]|jgi:UDP-3-O-[3-hydroxymyristoyl] N-acetylglucosamine deacetylase/3-hydroxyacyl-[acyl-carrier-protein] dehydratase|nr:UDP-3-O-acyl-N-acetylglucosamine deacetylase [Gammaproteobacteria bacterium]MBT4317335.1 UDP-3-O-[3-hydroxymyristoyl] N-acetylglucosamine deacetylase [Candidatus Neomarinimicrobiota bacterium]MBT4707090.1 UDP-3-O-[3-hydroxymyristoyl] N-acetylglucosamine deacetylase [Candidatus Neomarinimicrobiota bacterium]MBT6867531.1 UDP-3-O-[3-hydroxymyristoyl] N-acetylglucosamine deacetylase [Candidatus Neomarinimicrobiota bacterium]MBT7172581.1 UDP-3-O-[3-hydroxymyristoyl] N-acetylglucosamine deacetylas